MSEAKRTPGPWHVEQPDYDTSYSPTVRKRVDGLSYLVAGTIGAGEELDYGDVVAANARLIAEAPAMAAALKAMVDSTMYGDLAVNTRGDHKPLFEAAREALRKAGVE